MTAVGGSGLGILSPYDEIAPGEDGETPPLSPPMTPDPNRANSSMVEQPSIRKRFESLSIAEMSSWASTRGKWLYV